MLNYWKDLAIPTIDILALLWFLFCWIGYHYFSQFWSSRTHRLQNALKCHIERWVTVLHQREMRMVDTSVVANLERNATFLASSSLLIIAGLLTVSGSVDKAMTFFQSLPFAEPASAQSWELKLIILVVIYAYAFFTFTWCMRQYGFLSIMIGNAPLPTSRADESSRADHIAGTARMMYLSVISFNMGLRAYYFSIAMLFWFFHPWLFMLAAAWITVVLYRREFHSNALRSLTLALS